MRCPPCHEDGTERSRACRRRLLSEPPFGCDKSRKLGFLIPTSPVPPEGSRYSGSCGQEVAQGPECPLRADAPPSTRQPVHLIVQPPLRPRSSNGANDTAGRGHAAPAGNGRHCLVGLKALLDNLQLLLRRPMPSASRAGDQFNPSIIVRHKPVLEDASRRRILAPPAHPIVALKRFSAPDCNAGRSRRGSWSREQGTSAATLPVTLLTCCQSPETTAPVSQVLASAVRPR